MIAEMQVDVRPFMQRNPFIVHADASLSRAYRLFRTMGLRHLFVCEPQPRVSTPALTALALSSCFVCELQPRIRGLTSLFWTAFASLV